MNSLLQCFGGPGVCFCFLASFITIVCLRAWSRPFMAWVLGKCLWNQRARVKPDDAFQKSSCVIFFIVLRTPLLQPLQLSSPARKGTRPVPGNFSEQACGWPQCSFTMLGIPALGSLCGGSTCFWRLNYSHVFILFKYQRLN